MAHETILVVEDETDIVELHRYNLEKEGYKVYTATNGEQALKLVGEVRPQLVLLDLLLPGIDGLEVCRRIRQAEASTQPRIIMVTAKSEDPDIITGLEIGADDYVGKPFSPKVLIARIRNVLRRKRTPGGMRPQSKIFVHEIVIDLDRYEVEVAGRQVALSATEFAILKLFAENPGRVFSRSQIINRIKGEDYPVTERAVDVQILGLRKKLGEQGGRIKTVRGIGYCLEDTRK